MNLQAHYDLEFARRALGPETAGGSPSESRSGPGVRSESAGPAVETRTRPVEDVALPGPSEVQHLYHLLFLSLRRGRAPRRDLRGLHPSQCACITRVRCLVALAVRLPGFRAGYLWTPYSSGLG